MITTQDSTYEESYYDQIKFYSDIFFFLSGAKNRFAVVEGFLLTDLLWRVMKQANVKAKLKKNF